MPITSLDGERVDEAVLEGKTVFTIPSKDGHDRLVWDAADPQQVKEAVQKFDEYIEKGYVAYLVDDEGHKSEIVTKSSWRRKDVRQREELLFEKPKECRVMAPVVVEVAMKPTWQPLAGAAGSPSIGRCTQNSGDCLP